VRAGRCLRLYTKGDFDARPEHDAPEVSRLDLAETVLSLEVAGHDAATFPWLTRPSDAALEAARTLLLRLGAIDGAGAPTRTGRAMARLPLPPRLSRLVVEGAARGVAKDACGVAAMLSLGRDVYGRDREARVDEPCDASVRLRDLGDRHAVDPAIAASVRRVQRQLEGLVDGSRGAMDPDVALRTAILAAFPDRVARRRGHGETLVLAGGGQATLARSSVVRTAPWVVAVEALDRRGTSTVTMATAIEPDWLIDLFPERIAETTEVRWDDGKERVEAVERMAYDKLTLDERPTTAGPAVAALLAERALAVGLDAFVGGAFSELSARIGFVTRAAKDLADDAGLVPLDPTHTRELLVAACAGRRSFAELREGDLLSELRAALGHGPLARLDALAPTHVVLGNGRRATVTYPADAPPSIASRLQDFFGSADGPRVLAGRVPVVLHLLAPTGRDVQVTTDLAGFWDRHYPQIRNELRRRYPRHAWPDDPRTAAPPELRRR
jgi:ATP-dependent helicase HrpB